MFQNKAYDISTSSKKHLLLLDIVVKLNSQCKKDHFDWLNPEMIQNHSGEVVNHTSQINILLEIRKLH